MKSRLVRLLVCRHLLSLAAALGTVCPASQPPAARAETAPLLTNLPADPLEDPPQTIPRGDAPQDRVEALAYFAAARTAEQRGETAAAVRLYQRSARRDPNAHAVLRSLVSLLCGLGRESEAARYVPLCNAWRDSDAVLLRRLGIHLSEEGQWKTAIAIYRQAARARGGRAAVSTDLLLAMELGRLYQLDEQCSQAAVEYDRVLAAIDRGKNSGLDDRFLHVLLGDEATAYGLMGDCYLQAGRREDALRLFQRSHAAVANLPRLQFNQARVLSEQGKPRESLALLEQALAGGLAGEGTAPYELLCESLRACGRTEQIVPRLEELYAADAKSYPLAFALAQAHMAVGETKKAELLLAGLLEVRPNPTVFRSMARLLRSSGKMDQLMELLGATNEKAGLVDCLGAETQAIVADEPSLRSLGDAARRLMALPSQANHYGVAASAAALMLEGKRYGAAAEFFEAAIAARSEKEAELLLAWGVGLLLDQRHAEAATVLGRCADAKGKDNGASARYHLAAALARCGRGDEAVEAARQAWAARPEAARYAVRLGWACRQNRQLDAAERHYRAAVERFNADHASQDTRAAVREAKMALADICASQGRAAEAKEWLEQVLDEFPGDPDALDAQARARAQAVRAKIPPGEKEG